MKILTKETQINDSIRNRIENFLYDLVEESFASIPDGDENKFSKPEVSGFMRPLPRLVDEDGNVFNDEYGLIIEEDAFNDEVYVVFNDDTFNVLKEIVEHLHNEIINTYKKS
jgi:hypothetical protein